MNFVLVESPSVQSQVTKRNGVNTGYIYMYRLRQSH